ncbi:MAG TPA: DNA polymerase IV [Gordonia sp. (in: high G+C Gram-positive bacteria)]|uniref:DNA polymerase IV n=1 Tax=unclassified Gordonia (in: high G+C Gram-positive bacteria) TaxID=2657482 RepID=UPI0025C2D6CB|nr:MULTISPECIES: DNA polymerase IV [unclassified Gordonia (in: high G+C Gram-positive bacteria)]HNP58874.1 DNA polymerase IV [Gordonia sp. (in: high G+C Gram-positive bacteria)]HRC52164.1 DNA polymerase IV [Gordonia sp. (in: high G+C Gram-positive bacteria)]
MGTRRILHVDLDQFQVSVERRRSPELVGVPVIVGGDGDPTAPRKVVTCASYEARAVGVRAGMPLRVAHRKMPDAVYLPLDVEAYDDASAEVMATLRGFGAVEVWGWDEAYLGAGELDDEQVAALAVDVIATIGERTGLPASIGISDNKQRAKMATNFAKRASADDGPRVFRLDADNWGALMGPQPTRELWSVGPKTATKLSGIGVQTVDELVAVPKDDLIATFGPHQGNWLYVLCRGGGDSTITPEPWEAKSHSHSRTFPTDLDSPEEMHIAVDELTEHVLAQVVDEDREVFRVAVTVRTKTFYTRTKSRKLPAPTTESAAIGPVVHALLDDFELDRPVRLLGVRLDLVASDT